MRKIIILSFFCSTVLALVAQGSISDFIENKLLQNATISLNIVDLHTGKPVCEFRPASAAIPASTMKLVTTSTALELLGADFRFQTYLEIDGTIADSVLNGNLYIYGGADPTLGSKYMGDSKFLDKWANAVKRAGIKEINGRVIADASFFDTEGINPRWTWEDIGNYYAAGIYGISYLDNTYELVLQSGLAGTTPKIIEMNPSIPELTFDNHLKSTSIAYDSAYIYGAPRAKDRAIYGAIPANRARFTIKGDIPNPDVLLVNHFVEKLRENDILIKEDVFFKTGSRKSIYTHQSPPLSDIIRQINVRSNNHYAEHLFRYLGALNQGDFSTSNAAINKIKSFWKEKGLPVEQLFMNDGSGLSPTNAVSATFFTELLIYMQTKSKNSAVFKASLPVAGENGTVSNFLKNTALKGKVHVKSGSIERVRSYAGYIDANGKNYAFAVIVNNANGSSRDVVKKTEKLLTEAIK